MSHDPCCPLDSTSEFACPICEAVAAARGQEKSIFNDTWKANLPLVERRWYLEGYADGAAGHAPPERFR